MTGAADIDVTFATNAPVVSSQIDKAAASTSRAAGAATAHNAAAKQETLALKAAAAAAREKAAAEAADAAATTKAANAARQRAVQGAGFLGAGRFATGAQALVGKDAGVGAILGATAVMAGVGLAIGMLTGAVEKWLNKADEQIKVTEEASKAYSEARKANIDRGVGAAGSFGGGLTRLTALGLRGQVDRLAPAGFGAGDVSGAAGKAADLFPGRETQALNVAANVAQTLGATLSDVMGKMEGMRLGDGTAASLAGRVLGRRVTGTEFAAMNQRVAGSAEVASVEALNVADAKADLFAISQISRASAEAEQRLVEMKTAEADAARTVTAEFNKIAQIQKDQAEQVDRIVKGLATIYGFGYAVR